MENIIVIDEMKDAAFYEVARLDCEDEMLRFSAPVMGKGLTAFIPLAPEAIFVYNEGAPEHAFKLRYSQYFQDKIMISLMISGTATHSLGTHITQPVAQGQSFIYATLKDISYVAYPATKRFEMAALVFDHAFFDQCLDRFFSPDESLKKEALKAGIFSGNLQGNTHEIVQDVKIIVRQILSCRLRANFRRVFLECKLFELLAYYFQSITEGAAKEITFSGADIAKLQEIKKALSAASLSNVSIAQLCKAYGINRFKLNMGFQSLFNTTVIRYYRQQLLYKAHDQLTHAGYNVTQAAIDYGYNNAAAFSRAFFKEFGYRPGKVKKMLFG
ncbi:helix-turn-helix domain-containing protein [Taibaiella koreensis]|uniref:helix-turn-helix domain-containing protein n=1 Tax=Taibaiella koreensis TaxID=1268548 RepID=UPI0013C36A4A|nr:helix-turn-helix transcriptional regulator [Taibaiella koreensis]